MYLKKARWKVVKIKFRKNSQCGFIVIIKYLNYSIYKYIIKEKMDVNKIRLKINYKKIRYWLW